MSTVPPLFTDAGDADNVTVGCAAEGAGAACVGGVLATCFLQPPMNPRTAATPNKNVNFPSSTRLHIFPPSAFPGFRRGNCRDI